MPGDCPPGRPREPTARATPPRPLPLLRPLTGPRLDSVFLVFEYCPHDLGKLVDSLPRPLQESEVKCLVEQVSEPESLCLSVLPACL